MLHHCHLANCIRFYRFFTFIRIYSVALQFSNVGFSIYAMAQNTLERVASSLLGRRSCGFSALSCILLSYASSDVGDGCAPLSFPSRGFAKLCYSSEAAALPGFSRRSSRPGPSPPLLLLFSEVWQWQRCTGWSSWAWCCSPKWWRRLSSPPGDAALRVPGFCCSTFAAQPGAW